MFALRNLLAVCNRAIVCGAVGVILASGAMITHGQQYSSAPVKIPQKEANALRTAFQGAVSNPAGFGASEQQVTDYLSKVFFPAMTGFTDEALMKLADARRWIRDQTAKAGNASARQYLIEETYKYGRGMARGNFHPAVRYNAVLMLGELDQQQPTATAAAVPLTKATQELLELIEQEKFNKIIVPESVKLGALIGLERHSRLGIDPSLKDPTTTAMIKVAGSATPEDVDSNVHDWVRRTAAQVLANQYKAGPTKPVQAALSALIADKQVGFDERCATAAALKRITYPANADIDGAAATNALGQLALDVVTDAAKLAREYQKEAIATGDFSARPGGGGGGYGGEYGGGRGYGGGMSEQDLGPHFDRRQVFARLNDVVIGAKALEVGVADESKTRLEALTDTLTPALQAMEDKGATEINVSDEVVKLEVALKTLLASWGQPAAAAAQDPPPEKEDEALAEN
jgi:hypothetical protein